MDENGNFLADLFYDDLLFLQKLATLCKKEVLTLNLNNIFGPGEHTAEELHLSNIASYYKPEKGGPDRFETIFKRLWTELGSETSQVKVIFKDREIPIRPAKNALHFMPMYKTCLYKLFEYAGRITPNFKEDTDPYEYFSKDHQKKKSKYYGQFYTPDSLVNSVIEEIKPVWGDTMCDFAAGTSKFLKQAAIYASTNDYEKRLAYDAFKQMDSYEIESKIHRQGFISLLVYFESIPDTSKIQLKNAFESLKDPKQYKKLVGNPPYGGTVVGFEELYYSSESVPVGKKGKIKHILKKRPEICFDIPFIKNDTCVLFLQLYTVKLETNGICGLILNGTIMNNQHRDVMKWFLTECNLYKIIVNPSGTFKNTNIETYSFIFTKGSPTQKIEYYTVETGEKLGEFTRAQIEANDWDIRPIFGLNTLRNLKYEHCSIENKFLLEKCNISASKAIPGDYAFMTLQDNATHNTFEYDGENIFISTVPSGTGTTYTPKVRYSIGKVNASSLMNRIVPKDNTVFLKYFYYYWKFQPILLKSIYQGTANKSLDKERFRNHIFPIPPIPIQEEIVANLDRLFANPQDMKETLAFTDRAMDLMLQDPTGAQLEDLVESIRLRRHHQTSANFVKHQTAAIMRSVSARGFEQKKLGDLYDTPKTIKRFNSGDKDPSGTIPFFNGKWNCPDGTHTDYSFELDSPYFVMIKDGGGDHSSDSVGMGKFFKVHGKCAITSHNMILSPKENNKIEYNFIYHYFTSNAKSIRDMAKYSINLGSISKESILNFEIPIPPLHVQTEILAILNEMEAELKILEQMAIKAETRARFILDGYLSTPATVVEEAEAEPEAEEEEIPSTPSPTLSIIPPIPLSKPDYKAMSKPELLEQCKNNNIKGVSNKKKEDLIQLLEAL
jgi:restriction endonuclease S subunit